MAKNILFGETREDGKIRVWRTQHAAPGKELDEKSFPEGYAFAAMPEHPAPKRGVDHIMLYDPKTEEFSFEEKQRPLAQEEVLESLVEQIGALVQEMKLAREAKE